MGGPNPQQEALQEAARTSQALSTKAYGIALPALTKQYGLISQGLAEGGQPGYMRDAFTGARTSLAEAGANAMGDSRRQLLAQTQGATLGGNVGASTALPGDIGQTFARALYGSRVAQASSQIEQQQKLQRMALGQGIETGSGSLAAFGNELHNISGIRNYNPTYANVLGAMNAASSLYGGAKQAGWFNQTPATMPGGGQVGGWPGLGF